MSDEPDAKPPENALLAPASPAPRLRLAESLATVRAGELVAIDGRGRVLRGGQRRLIQGASWTILGTTVAVNGLIYALVFSPLAGIGAAAVTGAYLLFKFRKWPAYRAAMALVADSRWEEAHARLAALTGGGLPRVLRRQVPVLAAALDNILGRQQAALDRVDPVLAELGDSSMVVRWQAASVRACALAQLGRLTDALRELERFQSPRTEYVELLYQSAALSIAFEADTPDSLPAIDVLHDWARAALQRSRFGETLVGLSWAFHRRGDDDMARHLLAESASRMPRSSLPTAQPRLEAWAAGQRVVWGIEAGKEGD